MSLIMTIMFTIILMSICFLFCVTVRINEIAEHRMILIHKINELNLRDFRKGIPYTPWRWDEYKTVLYRKQLIIFWKPCDYFYEGKKFFEEIQTLSITTAEPDKTFVS